MDIIAKYLLGVDITQNEIASFSDLEPEIKTHYTRQLIGCSGLLIIAIILGITFRSITTTIYISIVSLGLLLVMCYRIFLSLAGQLAAIKGVYFMDNNDEAAEGKSNWFSKLFVRTVARRYILIMDEHGTFFKVYPPKKFSAMKGNEILVYAPRKSLFQQNNDTIVISTLYHITITNTVSSMVMQNH